jgi:Xaa-Pro aminopeptidase
VPAGVVELIRRLGGSIVSSAPLVTRLAARWSPEEREGHVRAAAALAAIARDALAFAVPQAGRGLTESALQGRVIDAIRTAGLVYDHPPIVAFGAHTADPHYTPEPGRDTTLAGDQVVLLDLWAGPAAGMVFADQTWIGFSGRRPPDRVRRVWEVVREAREAAIELVHSAVASGTVVHGFEVDRAARAVIEVAGFGDYFVHRTGHSIDRDLHGSGPHCDDYETRDDRALMEGIGFSIEPGIYLPGEFGMRSEVNMYWGPEGAVVTPDGRQQELVTITDS